MLIVVITPENNIRKENELVNDLFKNGLKRLHLRKPDHSTEETRKYIRSIDPQYHPRIVLTGNFELFNEFDLGGIHLNGSARRNDDIRKKIDHLSPELISTSYHTWQKIVENEFHFGYVFISPVFDSISKKEYKSNIDPYGARKTKQKLADQNKYCPKIIGLGGVGINEIKALHEYGFDGAAMLGTLWMSGNPVTTFIRAMTVAQSLQGQDA
jgi:thiamine-phosphate pyrophosphorylase